MAIELSELPFAMDELEPYMSERTLQFHYGKHHKHYVDTLNELIQGTPLDRRELGEIVHASHGEQVKVFNNAAQAWNHTFFWSCLTSPGAGPSQDLQSAVAKTFGSMDEFREKFTTQAIDLFGSGWTWLVKDKGGRLKIRPLGNAGTPIVDGDIPLLTCDVWEHAYYLDYQNERPRFLESFWQVVNWEFVEANLESNTDGLSRVYPHQLRRDQPGAEVRQY